ncbi:MFS transporter [Tumebacillus algifaecis]|uniref:MFS transporter n=1 Tax=Tumebacillus algifaecis TaxID=1214604 RepID=A0A223CZD9_9BACL|nr:MFS transporter [Tumebacillus algifaecis]ASS74615.1 MFS transporter [Tumebacillus algifaecis]
MNWIQNIYRRYDTTIWVRAMGSMLTTVSTFMLRPFLALYLYDKLEGDLLITTLIVALQPGSSIIAALYAGGLSDRYGRKPLMLFSLLITFFTLIGFAFVESLTAFAILSIINGIGSSLFGPAASAQIADIVPENRRAEVFALMHTCFNVGVALGPLIGVLMYNMNPSFVFLFSAAVTAVYALVILTKIPETLPEEVRNKMKSTTGQKKQPLPKMRFRDHKLLWWLTLGILPFTFMYSQVEIILPQHLKTNFTNYVETFALLMTVNGILVMCFQILTARIAEKYSMQRVVLIGLLLCAVTAFGYGWSNTLLLLLLSEFIFTIGEMLFMPQAQKAVSILAPVELRARYFAVYGLNWNLTRTFGPFLGAYGFGHFGGSYWFSIIALLLIAAAIFMHRLISRSIFAPKPTPVASDTHAL